MASIEELLRYLEQFMTGHLNQQHTGAPSGAGIPAGGGFAGGGAPASASMGMPTGGGGPSGGGMPPGAGQPPPGGGTPGGSMPGGMAPGGESALPPELAGATAEQVQEALLQFAALHPELAPFFTGGREPSDLSGVLGQLSGIPPEALAGYTPAFGEHEFGNLGGLAADEIGQWAQASDLPVGDLGTAISGDLTGSLGQAETTMPPLGDIDSLLTGVDASSLDPTSLDPTSLDPSSLEPASLNPGGLDAGVFGDGGVFGDPGVFGDAGASAGIFGDSSLPLPTFDGDPSSVIGSPVEHMGAIIADPGPGEELTDHAASLGLTDPGADGLDAPPDFANDPTLSFSDPASDTGEQF